MYLLILALPLFNFLWLILTGFFFNKKQLLKLVIINMITLMILSSFILKEIIIYQNPIKIEAFY